MARWVYLPGGKAYKVGRGTAPSIGPGQIEVSPPRPRGPRVTAIAPGGSVVTYSSREDAESAGATVVPSGTVGVFAGPGRGARVISREEGLRRATIEREQPDRDIEREPEAEPLVDSAQRTELEFYRFEDGKRVEITKEEYVQSYQEWVRSGYMGPEPPVEREVDPEFVKATHKEYTRGQPEWFQPVADVEYKQVVKRDIPIVGDIRGLGGVSLEAGGVLYGETEMRMGRAVSKYADIKPVEGTITTEPSGEYIEQYFKGIRAIKPGGEEFQVEETTTTREVTHFARSGKALDVAIAVEKEIFIGLLTGGTAGIAYRVAPKLTRGVLIALAPYAISKVVDELRHDPVKAAVGLGSVIAGFGAVTRGLKVAESLLLARPKLKTVRVLDVGGVRRYSAEAADLVSGTGKPLDSQVPTAYELRYATRDWLAGPREFVYSEKAAYPRQELVTVERIIPKRFWEETHGKSLRRVGSSLRDVSLRTPFDRPYIPVQKQKVDVLLRVDYLAGILPTSLRTEMDFTLLHEAVKVKERGISRSELLVSSVHRQIDLEDTIFKLHEKSIPRVRQDTRMDIVPFITPIMDPRLVDYVPDSGYDGGRGFRPYEPSPRQPFPFVDFDFKGFDDITGFADFDLKYGERVHPMGTLIGPEDFGFGKKKRRIKRKKSRRKKK